MTRFSLPRMLTLARRLTAVGTAWLVLVLGWLAVDPAAHAWVHGATLTPEGSEGGCPCGRHHDQPAHDPAEEGHSCIISQFAAGVGENGSSPMLASTPALRCTGRLAVDANVVARAAPRHLPRSRAPPAEV